MIQRKPITEAEELVDYDMFCAIVQDGQKADLIDGVIYMASPDSYTANTLTGFIYFLMNGFASKKKLGGGVFVNRFAFRISDLNAPEPDVSYVQPARMDLILEGGMRGGPDIAVEIVAKESRDRDYRLKRDLYEQSHVTEYWILDYLQHRAEFLRLHEGKYELVPLEQNRIFKSSVMPGFWLDVDWLFRRPLPDASECLESILKD